MSAVSFALSGAPVPTRSSDQSGRGDLNGASGAGEEQVQKQQRAQDDASAQRLGAQLRQSCARASMAISPISCSSIRRRPTRKARSTCWSEAPSSDDLVGGAVAAPLSFWLAPRAPSGLPALGLPARWVRDKGLPAASAAA